VKPDPERLRSVPLLADLSDPELAKISGWSEERKVSEGQRLTPEGASGYVFFLILDGTADVMQEDRRIRSLGPGDYFGEVAILEEEGKRTASVVATSPMTLAAIFGTEFWRLEQELPQVVARIRETAAARTGADS
jgi:CRP-like cAMP-binding protein